MLSLPKTYCTSFCMVDMSLGSFSLRAVACLTRCASAVGKSFGWASAQLGHTCHHLCLVYTSPRTFERKYCTFGTCIATLCFLECTFIGLKVTVCTQNNTCLCQKKSFPQMLPLWDEQCVFPNKSEGFVEKIATCWQGMHLSSRNTRTHTHVYIYIYCNILINIFVEKTAFVRSLSKTWKKNWGTTHFWTKKNMAFVNYIHVSKVMLHSNSGAVFFRFIPVWLLGLCGFISPKKWTTLQLPPTRLEGLVLGVSYRYVYMFIWFIWFIWLPSWLHLIRLSLYLSLQL